MIGTPVSGRVMLVTAAVPEPPTYALALSALALAALFGARRRVRGAPRPDFRPALVAAAGLVALAAWLSDSAAASDFAPATFAGDGAGGALTTDAGEAAAHAAAWSQGGMQPLPLLPQPAQAGGLSLAFEFDDSLGGYALPPLREADVVQLTHLAACFAWHKRIDRRTVNAMRLISRLLPTESAGPMPLAPLPEDVTAP